MPLPSIPLDLPVQPEIPLAACRVLAAGLNHPEAVVVAPDGWLYAGGEAGEIYRVHARSGQFRTIARTGGFCLGLAFAGPRELIICDEGKHCIWRCDLAAKTPKLSRLASQVAGQNLRTPNYPALDPAGRLWVADSGDWDGNNGCLLCWDHSGTGTIVSRECAAFPNGLAFSLAGRAQSTGVA